ncbi:hypothetical protein N9X46_07465 [Paracoccaceae bacterium]|nr:hypothetical protein [Paracoccaceae bacterium]
MINTAVLSAFWANPIFWQSVLLALAVLLFGLVALLLRVARLNRNMKALALRLTALESRPGQSALLPQKMAPLPKTNFAHDPAQPDAAEAVIPEFSADSMIETAISMIKAGDAADQIQTKLGIEPELLAILIQQHKPA